VITALILFTTLYSLNQPLTPEIARYIGRECKTPNRWLWADPHGHVHLEPGKNADAAKLACVKQKLKEQGVRVG
jgi:hypothetical protein